MLNVTAAPNELARAAKHARDGRPDRRHVRDMRSAIILAMRIGLIFVAVVIAAAASARLVAARRWNATSAALVRELEQRSAASTTRLGLSAELAALPRPVQRYLRAALGDDPPTIQFARIEHAGEFLLKPPNEWRSFTSIQYIATQPPGFVWDARIRMAPGLDVTVRDALVAGRGSMLGRVAGIVTVVDVKDTPDITSGALHRYLAEAVWVPTALLPSAGVQWSAIDDSTARATLGVAQTSVSLDFHFGRDGLIERVFTPARMRDVAGRGVPTPWEGRFQRYERRGAFLVPVEGEVAWQLPEGRQAYWRGKVTDVRYSTAAR
jgi:uncharacterized protein DUF6920